MPGMIRNILFRRPWLPLLVLLLCTPATWAQRPGQTRQPQRNGDERETFRDRIRQRREAREAPQRSTREQNTRGPLERVLGGSPFQPRPEDFAPLEPGEEKQLRQFMHDRMPAEMQRRLSLLLRRSPDAFERRVVPRLRQLRRVFETNPEIGALLAQHMSNAQRIKLHGTQWNRDPDNRERVRDAVRSLVAENYRIETEVLADRLHTMKRERDKRVSELYDLYQDPETNLSAEPEAIRTAVEKLNTAPDGNARQRFRARLRDLAGKRIDREIAQAETSLKRRHDDEAVAVQREWEHQIHAMPQSRP